MIPDRFQSKPAFRQPTGAAEPLELVDRECADALHEAAVPLWGIFPPILQGKIPHAIPQQMGENAPMQADSNQIATPLQANLVRLMAERGMSARALSLKADLNETAVKAILSGRSKNPRQDTIGALARALDVDVSLLIKPGAETLPAPNVDHTRPIPKEALLVGEGADLPVYGAAQGGPDGIMIVSNDPIEWVRRPEPLARVVGGFGFYVSGDSMSPAYEQGDILLIHPSRPPRMNEDVVLELNRPGPGRHMLVKRLIRVTDRKVHLRQYNPYLDFELDRHQVRQMAVVVGKYSRR